MDDRKKPRALIPQKKLDLIRENKSVRKKPFGPFHDNEIP